ncbi:Plasma membrane permease, mediates uptake of glycerophosphoinositol and glycerophosphocholine [Gnomoniopsis sp. IMI 355080]|nr:Plasma membrane permease, mediates uptake of glycerophosphoinositol and glycerophosphocholine [Gnomoniopsis sp. IMI 355080]
MTSAPGSSTEKGRSDSVWMDKVKDNQLIQHQPESSEDVETSDLPPQAAGKRSQLSDLFTIVSQALRRPVFGELFADNRGIQFCAGAALISDGYQNNLMTMTNVLFKQEYAREYTSPVSTRVSNALLVGEALARGIVGFGTGGEYPASSTSASEAANEHHATSKRRGPVFILVTNLPLSLGGPFAVIVFLIVLSAAGKAHLSTVWRVCFGIGCLFPLSVFYFRIKMMNSKLYRRSAIKRSVPYRLVLRYYWKSLLGTCGAWFLYDFVTFPNGVFSGTIISSVVSGGNTLLHTAEWQLLLGVLALPGVLLGAWACDRVGRKNVMMIGFGGYIIFGLIIGLAYDQITQITPLFVIFYGLMQSSGNFGPGNMLGLLSSEGYATSVRGTCYGISAAFGKAGAAVGTEAFTPIQESLGKKWTFIIAAICGLAGILVTWALVPNVTDEDLGKRDEMFRLYLVEHGWNGIMGEDDLKGLAEDVASVVVADALPRPAVVGSEKVATQ